MAAGPSSAVASRPCSRTSASAPDRKIALTTPPRAVAARRPRAGLLAIVACPEGALATAARAAGLPVATTAARTLQLRGRPADAAAHLAGLAGLARDVARLSRGAHRPAALVAWGARAILATALLPRRARAPVL